MVGGECDVGCDTSRARSGGRLKPALQEPGRWWAVPTLRSFRGYGRMFRESFLDQGFHPWLLTDAPPGLADHARETSPFDEVVRAGFEGEGWV